ncbi:MAG: uroporphyrinogen decarboxylase [Armatimonadetes bacterium]|nr:uroporphyrinogen decarboxylase [Armatimonadota bacterium]
MPEKPRFLKACAREPLDCTPVWFMRQAGRYMPEYMKIREKHNFLKMCCLPDIACEVTLQPLVHGVDAAILFSDILLPLLPMGIKLEFAKGEGPHILNPVREQADVDRLQLVPSAEGLPFVLEAIHLIRKELSGKTPLIGFAGAPFTLASYLIEGGASKSYIRTKCLMLERPDIWKALMEKLSDAVLELLSAQIRAGVDAVQLFDSWVGCLNPSDYAEFVEPYSRKIFSGLANEGVPLIHFGTGTAALLPLMRDAGGTVIGLDWRVNLGEAWRALGDGVAVQGNLDPVFLLASPPALKRGVERVLAQAAGRPGHVFNVGHGILPETPPDQVKRVVEWVHALSAKNSVLER